MLLFLITHMSKTLTCPCRLITDREAGALWLRVADVGSLCGIVHRQHASMMDVGGPAIVVLIFICSHAFQHNIVYIGEREIMSVFKLALKTRSLCM